jgi:hypothetical protein
MNPASLTLVPTPQETPALRARRLMAEARAAAQEQIISLEEALAQVVELAEQIAEGGDLYPVGVRDLCRKLAGESVWTNQTLQAILHRTPEPGPRGG